MQLRHYLSLEEREEAVVIRSHVMDPHVVVAGFDELTDGLEMLLGIGTSGDAVREVVLTDELGRCWHRC